MNNLYPVTIYLAPVEYEALHDFCQYYANQVVNGSVADIRNVDLLLADFYKRTFTYARIQAFTAPKRRQSGKRYALKIGLIYARILREQLYETYQVTGPLVHVDNELNRALLEIGDVGGIKRLS
ncbi:hypothetical protein ACAW74_18250 [Fibrella sp. WM1]|uniref:hypothetical protein n=1 Tax=Fibrella musci TaxID=3242485 RepID=UPI0035204C2A